MAAVRHLGFLKFDFFNGRAVSGHQRTTFRKDRSNRCGDIAIFVIFYNGGCCHLEFSCWVNVSPRPPYNRRPCLALWGLYTSAVVFCIMSCRTSMKHCVLNIYSASVGERVCVCVRVCVCPRSYLLQHCTSDLHQFGRGSVLLWWPCDTLRISGYIDNAISAPKLRLLDVAPG